MNYVAIMTEREGVFELTFNDVEIDTDLNIWFILYSNIDERWFSFSLFDY